MAGEDDAATVAAVREHVGSTPDDATILAEVERLGSPLRAAESILRRRYADALTRPARRDLAGQFSDAQHDPKHLAAQLQAVTDLLPAEPVGDQTAGQQGTRVGRTSPWWR